MGDNNNIRGDDYGFDNIDSNNNASNGDDLDSGGGHGSREYNGGGYEFNCEIRMGGGLTSSLLDNLYFLFLCRCPVPFFLLIKSIS